MSSSEPSLEDEIRRIAGIADSCPPKFQERCFELLLEDLLTRRSSVKPPGRIQTPKTPDDSPGDEPTPLPPRDPEPPVDNSSDIVDGDLHVKAKSFMKKQGVSIGDLNEVLYKEDGQFLPLYEDLKSTKMSESQIRIALLCALRQGLSSGTFEFDGEEVRKECVSRKCYDPSNFTTNFKNSAGFFDGFDKYDKASPMVRLSEDGRAALANLIRELA